MQKKLMYFSYHSLDPPWAKLQTANCKRRRMKRRSSAPRAAPFDMNIIIINVPFNRIWFMANTRRRRPPGERAAHRVLHGLWTAGQMKKRALQECWHSRLLIAFPIIGQRCTGPPGILFARPASRVLFDFSRVGFISDRWILIDRWWRERYCDDRLIYGLLF